MSTLEFMQRRAALVPRPRLDLVRLHGGRAPKPGAHTQQCVDAGEEHPSDCKTIAQTRIRGGLHIFAETL